MKYVKFTNDGFGVKPIHDDYLLLFYFLSNQYPFEEMISEMESIKKGLKTFEQVYAGYAELDIGEGAGTLEYNKETAYLKSEDEGAEPSMEIPLEELINIIKDWIAHKRKICK